MVIKCRVCIRRVLSHSVCLQCAFCKNMYHIACLPNVSKSDSLYVDRLQNKWICIKCSEDLFPFNHYDDDLDFLQAMTGSCDLRDPNIVDLCKNVLNPVAIGDSKSFDKLHDIDPDIQFFNEPIVQSNCNDSSYYNENDLNVKLRNMDVNKDNISLLHLNIRSAFKNLDQFSAYLSNIDHQFSIVGLTETWCNETTVEFCNMSGFNSEHTYRKDRPGGGVTMLIDNSLIYKRRKDLEITNEGTESVVLEIDKTCLGSSTNLIVATFYRPPNKDITVFNSDMEALLTLLKGEKKTVYLMGDFNINLLNVDTHVASSDFLQCLYSYMFMPLINKPTRVTNLSATLIDNIYCNNFNQDTMLQGILMTDITDHFPIFCIDVNTQHLVKDASVYKRTFTNRQIDRFSTQLDTLNWGSIFMDDDCQRAYTNFYQQLSRCYNECFPIKKVITNYKTRKKWLTLGLKESIKTKNKLYVKSLRTPSAVNITNYKQYRNKLHSLLRKAERDYYDVLLKLNRTNQSKTWKILKDVINRTKVRQTNNYFKIGNKKVNDNKLIAEGFNKYFVNIGPNIAKDIPSYDNVNPVDYIKNKLSKSIFLQPTNSEEISNLIKQLKNCSPGYDGITPKIVKLFSSKLSEPLTHIFNLSLSQGVFPDELKLAQVLPLYKSGDSTSLSNYRPVSVLPIFSKVLERLVYNRVFSFINKNKLLYNYQFGFREGHGTNAALINLIDRVMRALDEGDYVLGVFLDFSKAFDTVNHAILLSKLNKYGINGIAQKWFRSYLDNRKQYTVFNNSKSSTHLITCGVPQGSILGPLLFLLYVNDIANVSDKLFTLLFADDSNMFIQGKDVNDLIDNVNVEMVSLVKWLNVNKLSLNVKKTKFMIFRSKRKLPTINRNLHIMDTVVQRVTSIRFLGVILDEKCDWGEHINMVKSKVSKGIGILRKARIYLKIPSLLTLYYSFLYPYLMYCIEVWGLLVSQIFSHYSCYKKELSGSLHCQDIEKTQHLCSVILNFLILWRFILIVFFCLCINIVIPIYLQFLMTCSVIMFMNTIQDKIIFLRYHEVEQQLFIKQFDLKVSGYGIIYLTTYV